MDPMHRLSAVALARSMRRGERSPVEVVEAHIARIRALNPEVNALVAERFDAARREAREAEARIRDAAADEELPPLLGLPITVKDFHPVAGLPHTSGSPWRREVVAERDGETVRRLREAGCIVVGLTNAPEGGLWLETYNALHGWTRNPHDLRHTSGGSSGGEGALVASGGSPLGLGADIGGSIRLPAAFCGVVGHKPTSGLVPNTGHWPPISGPAAANLTTGPLVRRVEDLMPLLRILSGPDGVDPASRNVGLASVDEVVPGRLRVLVPERLGRIQREQRAAIRRSARALEERGARVEPLRTPVLDGALSLWLGNLAAQDGPSFDALMTGGPRMRLPAELVRAALGRSRHIGPVLAVVMLERLVDALPGSPLPAGTDRAEELRAELEAELGEDGVLLFPPFPTTAPRHRAAALRPLGFLCTAAFNVLRVPVTQVPTGFDARGLPLGVQVVARRGGDHRTIAAAAVLEEALGGWIPARTGRVMAGGASTRPGRGIIRPAFGPGGRRGRDRSVRSSS